MDKYKALMQMGVFSLDDLNTLYSNMSTAASAKKALLKKGLISPIKRNLYVFNDIESMAPIADRFKIGSSIKNGAYISYHSALEFHGIAHQVFFEVTVSSPTRFKPFEFNGIKYQFVLSKLEPGVEMYSTNRGIRVTNLERTVIDCIDDMGRAGGLEELIECLRVITYLNEEKLMAYLKAYDTQVLYQKVGYILEQFKEELQLSELFFEFCRGHIQKSKRYLTHPGDEDLEYISKWRLYVPRGILGFMEQGGNELV